MKKEITPGVMARTDLYLDELAIFINKLYGSAEERDKFVEKWKDEYPNLLSKTIHLRIVAKKIFDKHYYSLRNKKFEQPEIKPAPQGWLK